MVVSAVPVAIGRKRLFGKSNWQTRDRLEGNGLQLADDYRFNALKRKGVDLIKYIYKTVRDMEYIAESDAHVKS